MPPEMAVSMRHTKLKPEEAALLAGEISKPSWESKNEGIHERVSFEDSIWGFDLAGGIYYKTPLRVTYVKPDSRADKAGIRPGDRLKRINDIDTSTLTIQQAHDMIIESGIHLKLSVTSPDDEEDAYYCYEDPLVGGRGGEEEKRRLEEELARKRRVHAKVSSYWSLQWPWVSKKRLVYRESNCFMVNSKYEDARREKYPPLPVLRFTDDIVHFVKDGEKEENTKDIPTLGELKERTRKSRQQKQTNGDIDSEASATDDELLSHVSEDERPVYNDSSISTIAEESNQEELVEEGDLKAPMIAEPMEQYIHENKDLEDEEAHINDANIENSESTDVLSSIPEILDDNSVHEESHETDEIVEQSSHDDDDVINEVLGKSDNVPRSEEENILDSILSDEGQNLESSEENNER